jgi:hypothetical protein
MFARAGWIDPRATGKPCGVHHARIKDGPMYIGIPTLLVILLLILILT